MSVSMKKVGRDARLPWPYLPSHLLGLWRQRLLQQCLAQEVQVIQATCERRFGGGCTCICFDWRCYHNRGDAELIAI